MTGMSRLHEALLELGLEDLIPLPEALDDDDVRDAVGGTPTIDEVATALVDLLRMGQISVWAGHWQDDPRRVDEQTALQLLRDPRRYTFKDEAEGYERVYFVNVENVI